MPKLTQAQKIEKLQKNRGSWIRIRVQAFRKRLSAQYDAKIDLLIQNITNSEDRYIYYRTRYHIYMGKTQQQAKERATNEYKLYKLGTQLSTETNEKQWTEKMIEKRAIKNITKTSH